MRTESYSVGKMVITRALAEKQPVKGLVYFLHGACDNGIGLQAWVNKTIRGNFAFKNFPVIYPSSPSRAYTLHAGKSESVWFDQLALNPNVPEDVNTINFVGTQLNKLIEENEKDEQISPENIIIGGFSMGGAMALHLGYRLSSNIGGVFALSSFLPLDSRLFEEMDTKISTHIPPIKYDEKGNPVEDTTIYAKFPKLFMSHGQLDPIVPIKWSKSTFNQLRKRGVDGHFFTMQNIQHSVNKQQLSLLHNWIVKTLEAKPADNTTSDTSEQSSSEGKS